MVSKSPRIPLFSTLRHHVSTSAAIFLCLMFASVPPATEGAATFTAKPVIKADGKGAKISFAVSEKTDVEIAVLDAQDKIVRHLAAGVLAPEGSAAIPFKPGLSQELFWDGMDDDGKPATGAPFKARVRLGVGTKLNRFIPTSNTPLTPASAIGTGPDGTLYVYSDNGHSSGAHIYAMDRDGKYLRTILPTPANFKGEQTKGLARLKLDDGSEAPVIYHAYHADNAPHMAQIQPQQLMVAPDGRIAFASGGVDIFCQIVPRHVLSINPDGSTPADTGFIGPPLGDYTRYATTLRPQQIAFSPDGKSIYFAGMGYGGKNPKAIHCIGRTSWNAKEYPQVFAGKPDEPGEGADGLNDPTSVATDTQGNVYVVDSGNNRIAAFSPDGKYLGETAVPNPGTIAIHPRTGALYVGSAPAPLTYKHEAAKPYSILKFDKAIGGKEVARYEFKNYRYRPILALDNSRDEPLLWMAYNPVYGRSSLLQIFDRNGTLVEGADALKQSQNIPFRGPMFLAADPARNRLYVSGYAKNTVKVDLKDDTISNFLKVSEVAVDKDGNIYALIGYGQNHIGRFDPNGKPSMFPGTQTNRISITYRAGLPDVGVRGITVAPNGDIYAYEEALKPQQLHVFGPDGKEKRKSIIQDIPVDSANGIVIGRDGSIYIGVNVHDPTKLYPDELIGQIPDYGWDRTYPATSGYYAGNPQHKAPEPPWDGLYINAYLYQYGSVFKFGPEGGRFWTGDKVNKNGDNPRPADTPPDALEFRTAMLSKMVWSTKPEWIWRGFGLVASRTENSGDPTCSCMTSRFCMDEYGRLWVPDVFRYRVTALDTAGNEICRFGHYGNVDSAGPGSLIPEPAIPFTFPNATVAFNDKVYVIDRKSMRIVVVDLTYQSEAVCEMR